MLKATATEALFGPSGTAPAGSTVPTPPAPADKSTAPAGTPEVIRMKITKASMPNGNPGHLGTMTVTAGPNGQSARVLWEYENGSTEEGWAVLARDSYNEDDGDEITGIFSLWTATGVEGTGKEELEHLAP